MAKFDPTFKTLVETTPEDWLPLVGQTRAHVDIIDSDIATIRGAADKVLRVRGEPPYLLHLEFQAGHDSAALAKLLQLMLFWTIAMICWCAVLPSCCGPRPIHRR